jgi:putative transposase
MSTSASLYPRHRFATETISHCVWLYFRFALRFRDVEEMLAMRGVSISYETVESGALSSVRLTPTACATSLLARGDQWHLDEVFLKINGRVHYLWRAVDQDGDVLDILVQSHRDKKAAKNFFRKLLKTLRYVPRVIITDKLKSYNAAKTEVLPSVEHCQQKYQNNRRELTSTNEIARACDETVQVITARAAFLSVFGIIASHFRVGRHRYRARGYREVMKSR